MKTANILGLDINRSQNTIASLQQLFINRFKLFGNNFLSTLLNSCSIVQSFN